MNNLYSLIHITPVIRCCERTMINLRENYSFLLTIVEVLLYDPLSDWSMSPKKAESIKLKQERNLG